MYTTKLKKKGEKEPFSLAWVYIEEQSVQRAVL